MNSRRERIELEEGAAPVPIPGRLLNELFTHALETRPEECCGLVTGVAGDVFRNVYRCRNTMTQQHENDRRRDDLPKRAGRTDRARGNSGVIAPLQHRWQGKQSHGHHGGADDTGAGRQ